MHPKSLVIFLIAIMVVLRCAFAQDTIKPHIKFVHYIGITGGTEYHPLKTNHAVTSRDSTLNPSNWAYTKSAQMKDLPHFDNVGWGIGVNYEAGLVNKKNTLQHTLHFGCAYGTPGTFYYMRSPYVPVDKHNKVFYPNYYYKTSFQYLTFDFSYITSIFISKNFSMGFFIEFCQNEFVKSITTERNILTTEQMDVSTSSLLTWFDSGLYFLDKPNIFARALAYKQFGLGSKVAYCINKNFVFEFNYQLRNSNAGPLHTSFFDISNNSNKNRLVQLHDYSSSKIYPNVSLSLKYRLNEKK